MARGQLCARLGPSATPRQVRFVDTELRTVPLVHPFDFQIEWMVLLTFHKVRLFWFGVLRLIGRREMRAGKDRRWGNFS
jgi:hypothetical protein